MIKGWPRALSPFRSVRGRFSAAMGGLGLVFGLLLTGIIEWRIERDLRAAAHDSLHSIASSIAHRLNEDLATRHREVALMADLLNSNLLSINSTERVIGGLKDGQPVYAWIGLADTQGVVLAASDNLLVGQNIGARPWFKAALLGGFVGDPHEAKLLAPHMKPAADGTPPRFIDVAVPLLDQNQQVVGVLGAHLYWDWVDSVVRAITERLDRPAPVEVLIADQSGYFLIKPHQVVATDLPGLKTGNARQYYVVAEETVPPVAGTNGLGWTIVVREQVKHAHAPIRESRTFMLLCAATLAAAFAALTWVVAGKVARPIVKLAPQPRARPFLRSTPRKPARAATPMKPGRWASS